ncbi:MAG TPA: hypothetical protein VD996_12375 [Chitinophagaceae bacterium]|nr:hypothetical protein [Chitinophagaceae bacterium]
MQCTVTIKFFIIFTIFANACNKDKQEENPFDVQPVLYPVTTGVIDEASGLADSYANAGFLWVNEDSDNPTHLYLLGHDGKHGKNIFVANATNRDWEEMMVGAGPVAGKKYIYIGDIGDNSRKYDEYYIYRFEEPAASVDTVKQVDRITFKYPDGAHDAEAFYMDTAKDIYIVTKRDAKSKVYRLPYPQNTSGLVTAEFVMDLPYSGVVGAAYSARGELLIKTYSNIYYYSRGNPAGSYLTLPYQVELQGEAVGFANDGTGFYTLSEKGLGSAVNLRFYKRK